MGNNNYTQDQDSGYLASTLRVYPAFLRQHLKYSPCLKRQLHPRRPVEEPLSMLLVSDPALELATLPTNSNAMAVLSVATSQRLVLPKAASGSHLLSTRAAVMPMMHTMRCTTSVSLVTIC